MNYLVTGSNGFLGQEVARQLLAAGHAVLGYDRSLTSAISDKKYSYVQGDLADIATLLQACQAFKPSAIIHTAAISHPVDSRRIPLQTVLTNAVGTTHVFETARISGVGRIVNLSSECAYGHNLELGVIDESADLQPTTPYGCTKVFTEKLGKVYNDLYGIDVISLRPGWIYGPGQFMQCYLKSLLRSAIDGTPHHDEEGGDYLLQYVHVSDVARACILAAEVPSDHLKQRVFNVTAGEQESYSDVARRVARMFPDANIDIGPGTISVLDSNARFSIDAAIEQLGYKPHYTLGDGLAGYADWLALHTY
ncbi:NAD(P)-dependent oxidoreductase [Pseudomonas mosselii]|uniref:NAD-dependent epimerase/dehydratase family protein n=1 Tax=unclassified Pseudomonas TaxID=196821 RepID=UPI0019430C7A|nr:MULTISPECIES: NAD(P)-dependent oxidoreductase [unclassified Pseudomonas]MCP8633671.1 NAD(P)-dependent oxidoreductase [Pseudomonas sp. DVZ6]MDD7785057.1 NAD(P)-dependent oxidoreductase [Pseudomonas sp. DVZ24]BCJ06795.1 dTDP-glucose 4,6-dehydratase [Pseudomonas sp. RtIB026]